MQILVEILSHLKHSDSSQYCTRSGVLKVSHVRIKIFDSISVEFNRRTNESQWENSKSNNIHINRRKELFTIWVAVNQLLILIRKIERKCCIKRDLLLQYFCKFFVLFCCSLRNWRLNGKPFINHHRRRICGERVDFQNIRVARLEINSPVTTFMLCFILFISLFSEGKKQLEF